MQEKKEIEMTDEDKKDFETATHCFICGEKLKNSYKMKKKQRNTKKLETTVILLVSTEVVLIAYVI